MSIKTAFITILITKNEKQITFEPNQQLITMVLNTILDMKKPISFLQKTILNPYLGALVSLSLIIPSLYIILEDVTVIRKEYIFLAIGTPIYIKSLNRIFDDILNFDKTFFK